MSITIIEGRVLSPRRIVIYGVHGIGKSTFGSMAPNPIFAPTEEGANDIDVPKFEKSETFEQFMEKLQWVYEQKHGYKTLVSDSLDWLERLIFAEVCAAKNVKNIEDIGYQKGYALALDYWRKVLTAFDAIREARGMTIACIAHAVVVRFEDPEMESYDRYIPALHKHATAIVTQWADEILFASYKTYAKKEERGGFKKDRVIGIGSSERVIKTTERPSHVANNRLNLPDEIPLDWREYAKYLPAAIPGSGEKKNGSKKATVTEPKLTPTTTEVKP